MIALLRAAAHRIEQGLTALFAFALPVDREAASAVLSPGLMALFDRMQRSEQLHSLRVMRWLQARGYDHPDLLTAALLHDSGKSRYPFTLVERTVVVLSKWLMPARAARWARGRWRRSNRQPGFFDRMRYRFLRAFLIAEQHPKWSAEDMREAGASALAISLACRHQIYDHNPPQTEEDHLLHLLQQADSMN